MKKRNFLLVSTLVIFLLVGCNSVEEYKEDEDKGTTEDVLGEPQADPTFTGTIAEINGDMALVEIEEGAILSSGDQVHIPFSIDDVDNFEVGDQVRIGYDGSVMESYPLQINMTFIEKVDE